MSKVCLLRFINACENLAKNLCLHIRIYRACVNVRELTLLLYANFNRYRALNYVTEHRCCNRIYFSHVHYCTLNHSYINENGRCAAITVGNNFFIVVRRVPARPKSATLNIKYIVYMNIM